MAVELFSGTEIIASSPEANVCFAWGPVGEAYFAGGLSKSVCWYAVAERR